MKLVSSTLGRCPRLVEVREAEVTSGGRRTLTGFFLAATILLLESCSSDRVELPNLPQIGLENFVAATREKLKDAYEAIRENPNDPEKNGELGMLLHALEQYQPAETCYRRAHLMAPDSFRWTYYLAVVQVRQGRNADAASTLRAASRLDPQYFMTWLRLGETLLAAGELPESRKIYESLVREHPDRGDTHYGLGRVFSAQGQLDVAVQHYRRACELAANFGAAHYALALAYRDLGQTEKSRQHLALYEQNKLTGPAVNDPLIQAVNRLKTSAADYLKKGVELEAAGRIKQAIAKHERALEVDPGYVQAHSNLLILYGKMGQLEKAEQHYHAAVKLNPNRAELHYNFGVLTLEQKRYRKATGAFRRAVEISPTYAEAHYNLAGMLEREGRIDEAFQHYREAVEHKPNYRLARLRLGWILLAKGRTQEAIQEYQKTLTPEDDQTPEVMYGLAVAYGRAGHHEKALYYARDAHRRATELGQTGLAAVIEKDLPRSEAGRQAE